MVNLEPRLRVIEYWRERYSGRGSDEAHTRAWQFVRSALRNDNECLRTGTAAFEGEVQGVLVEPAAYNQRHRSKGLPSRAQTRS